jgi:hypothetical protein
MTNKELVDKILVALNKRQGEYDLESRRKEFSKEFCMFKHYGFAMGEAKVIVLKCFKGEE